MAKKQNIEELVVEQTETVTEETVEPTTHTVQSGDTYVSISEQYRGAKSNHAYAKELIAKNNGAILTKGAIIVL